MTARSPLLIGERPTVDIKSTTAAGDKYVTSGVVTFALKDGVLKLTFPYKDAANEGQAIEQAARELKRVAEMFGKVAEEFSGPYKGNR
jgi:hypothetical protein